jgi:hypothetical protein
MLPSDSGPLVLLIYLDTKNQEWRSMTEYEYPLIPRLTFDQTIDAEEVALSVCSDAAFARWVIIPKEKN